MAKVQPDTLILQVCAGMANRLRALISGICLAEDLGKKLHVIWPANEPSCMVRFEMLFELSSLPSWVTVDMGPLEGQHIMVLSPEDLEAYLAKGDLVPIKSYGWFHQKDLQRFQKYLQALQPIQSISNKYKNLPYFENTIGVHIRRGDHEKSIKNSTIEIFVERMRKESETAHFLVATDSSRERKALIDAFGEERFTFPATTLSRMTMGGMQDALLDFIALSKTKKILGSYSSSFSEMAALYGNISLDIVKTTIQE